MINQKPIERPKVILPTEKSKATKVNPKILLIYALPKMGKALSLDSKILTEHGFKLMRNISLDDKVAGSDGNFYSIDGIFPQGEKDLYEITFKDETRVVCSDEHLWTVINKKVRTKGVRKIEIKTTLDLSKDFIHLNRTAYAIDYPKAINYSKREVTIHPYTLGLLIADGCLKNQKRLCLSKQKEQLIPRLEELSNLQLKYANSAYDYTIKSKEIVNEIVRLELNVNSYDKFIPENYLINSVENRVALLQGLMDGDGTAREGSGIEYSTASQILANQVVDLIQGLGGSAIIYERMGKYVYEDKDYETRPNYRIYIQFTSDIEPFTLKHKWQHYFKQTRYTEKAITNIKYIGRGECQCISTTSPDKLFITDGYNLTHNSSIISKLDECLLIDTEQGSDYLEALKIKVNSLYELNELGREIITAGKPYKYIAIDTITELENWCEIAATEMYRKSPLYSQKFSEQSVLQLPKGGGYLWLRLAFQRWFEYIRTLAEHIILIAHVKESEFVVKSGDEQREMGKDSVSSFAIDLVGKDKQIACSKADAIAFMYKKVIGAKNGKEISQRILNFKVNGETLSGSKPKHLDGQEIIISEQDENGEIVCHWDKVYI